MNFNSKQLYEEISKNEAQELLEQYVKNEALRKVIMSDFAEPGFQTAYKGLFDGLYVFCIKLSEELHLIISTDRTRFWTSDKDVVEIAGDINFVKDCKDSEDILK